MEGCAGDERNTQRLVREGCKVRDLIGLGPAPQNTGPCSEGP